MTLQGLNDTVVVKTKSHTTDSRGGTSTVLTTKIASLICSLQSVRREEVRMELQGQTIIDPYILLFDIITTGSTVAAGDIVEHTTNGTFLVTRITTSSGKGAHTEAILKKISGDTVAN